MTEQRPTAVVSDIDGTVVFSGAPSAQLVSVEAYSSGRHGQMTQEAHRGWGALAATGRLVVATTRTREQFLRLALPGPVHLAVVSNGYRVLVDGHEDAAWTRRIRDRLVDLTDHVDDIVPLVHEVAAGHDGLRCVTSDDVLLTLVTGDVDILPAAQAQIMDQIDGTGWTVARSGRKMYVLPVALDKGAMVEEVLADHGYGTFMAGGDSYMDASLVQAAVVGMVPRGSDLARDQATTRGATVRVTEHSGVEAGTEVVAAYEAFLRT